MNEQDQPTADEITRLYETYLQIARDIVDEKNPRDGYQRATELAERMRKLADLAAYFRAKTVQRIMKEEKLSGEKLAESLHVSKQRVGQLLKTAKKELTDFE